MAYLAQWGKVWHAGTGWNHLLVREERRSHGREEVVSEARLLIVSQPCKDFSGARTGVLSSPGAPQFRGAQR